MSLNVEKQSLNHLEKQGKGDQLQIWSTRSPSHPCITSTSECTNSILKFVFLLTLVFKSNGLSFFIWFPMVSSVCNYGDYLFEDLECI